MAKKLTPKEVRKKAAELGIDLEGKTIKELRAEVENADSGDDGEKPKKKRGRGRPPGAKNKKASKKDKSDDEKAPKKKGRGRPKKSAEVEETEEVEEAEEAPVKKSKAKKAESSGESIDFESFIDKFTNAIRSLEKRVTALEGAGGSDDSDDGEETETEEAPKERKSKRKSKGKRKGKASKPEESDDDSDDEGDGLAEFRDENGDLDLSEDIVLGLKSSQINAIIDELDDEEAKALKTVSKKRKFIIDALNDSSPSDDDEDGDTTTGPDGEVAKPVDSWEDLSEEDEVYVREADSEDWVSGTISEIDEDEDGDAYLKVECDDGNVWNVYEPEVDGSILLMGLVGDE